MININNLVNQIGKLNNIYRDPGITVEQKLEALWTIGDILYKNNVKNPHSLGWKVQHETKGIIKRPTIFRSYKIRTIWPSREDLLNECKGIQGLSNLIEMLPLLDPHQTQKHRVPLEVVKDLRLKMITMKPKVFKNYLSKIKSKHSDKTLGKGVDRQRHLLNYVKTVDRYNNFKQVSLSAMTSKNIEDRNEVRGKIKKEELIVFANMCLSITTKENYKLYRYENCKESDSQLSVFKELYDDFRNLLINKSDVRRARLRRLIDPIDLAEMADLCNSMIDEDKVRDYILRKQLKIKL